MTPINTFIGAARATAESYLGGPCDELESNPTITTTVGVGIDGNGDRVGLVFVNLGANPVYISLNSGVTSSNGILLGQSGGNISMTVRDDFTLPSRRWYAVSTGGNSAVYVLELIRRIITPPAEKP